MSNATFAAAPAPSPSAADSAAALNEDWLAVILGLAIFVLALAALVHVDLIGWVVSTAIWSDFGKALGPASKAYAALGGAGALIATYVALTVLLSGSVLYTPRVAVVLAVSDPKIGRAGCSL